MHIEHQLHYLVQRGWYPLTAPSDWPVVQTKFFTLNYHRHPKADLAFDRQSDFTVDCMGWCLHHRFSDFCFVIQAILRSRGFHFFPLLRHLLALPRLQPPLFRIVDHLLMLPMKDHLLNRRTSLDRQS